MRNIQKSLIIWIALPLAIILAFFILREDKSSISNNSEGAGSEQTDEDFVRGPHGGRLLSDGDFRIEVTIYEEGVPPQFRLYAFNKDKPVNPDEVRLTVELNRLGRKGEVINFQREGDYSLGDKIVEEPHSFDVKVLADWKDQTLSWEYSQLEGRVELTPEAVEQAGIVTETAGSAQITATLDLPGEIVLDANNVVRIVPRLQGVVTEVRKNLGDKANKDEVIAVIDSRELADAKGGYIESAKRMELARASYVREESLWKKKISPEEDYLVKRYAYEEAQITYRTARQKLITLGLLISDIDSSIRNPNQNLARYELRAPFSGVVIEKNISVGETVNENEVIFVIADLATVWVDATVYAKDLNLVKVDQKVTVMSDVLGAEIQGALTYVGPLVGEKTRSAKARVVIPNHDGIWRPGLYVTIKVVHEEIEIPLAVKAKALQTFRDWDVVFVRVGNLFEARPLELGRRDGEWVEVLGGLLPGDKYVSESSFILKADVEKAGASHEH
jgi:cobalt-zinc-cadmium efflux system membrane fusion protein